MAWRKGPGVPRCGGRWVAACRGPEFEAPRVGKGGATTTNTAAEGWCGPTSPSILTGCLSKSKSKAAAGMALQMGGAETDFGPSGKRF